MNYASLYLPFFRISKQIAPVSDEIFGCQIFVSNLSLGGANGYWDPKIISITNQPPVLRFYTV
jgi:hypothetical protein